LILFGIIVRTRPKSFLFKNGNTVVWATIKIPAKPKKLTVSKTFILISFLKLKTKFDWNF